MHHKYIKFRFSRFSVKLYELINTVSLSFISRNSHTNIHTDIQQTNINTYIHACIHTYIHT